MNTRVVVIILIVVALLVGGLLARNMGINKNQRGQLKQNISEVIAMAEQLAAEGSYDKSLSLYQGALASVTDLKKTQEIKQRVEDLHLKMLLSPGIDSHSIEHVVVKGDSLAKIAKQYHTTVELVRRANRLASDIIRVGDKLKVTTRTFSVVVDKSSNQLYLKSGEELLKTYTVSTGKNNCTPVGKFKIINKLYNPTWFKAGAVVPPNSPQNILGTRWMGFDIAGFGIHGTTEPEALGQQATAGCVRMRNEEVNELFDIIPVGTEVTVLD